MKRNFNIHLTILSVVLFAACAIAGVQLKWDVDTSKTTVKQFDAWNGETLDLEATLCAYRSAIDLTGKEARIYWQTNGMGSVYWQTNATVVASNVLAATFTPDMNPDARAIMGFIGVAGEIYRAAFSIRFSGSPGATPNELPLPQKVIDFAKVTVLNPPWSGGGGGVDTNAVREIVKPMIGDATNAVNVAMTNRYTKSETDSKITPIEAQIAALRDGKADKATTYTKTETDAKLGEKRDKDDLLTYAFKQLQDNWTISGVDRTKGEYELRYFEEDNIGGRFEFRLFCNGVAVGGTGWLWDTPEPPDVLAVTGNGNQEYIPTGEFYATRERANYGWVPAGDRLATTNGVNAAIAAHHDSTKLDRTDGVYDIIVSDAGSAENANFASLAGSANEAEYASRASKAIADFQGNTIHETYATKTELAAAVSTNNPAFVSAVRSIMPTTLRAYDPVRQCWWNIQPVNGVLTLTVED